MTSLKKAAESSLRERSLLVRIKELQEQANAYMAEHEHRDVKIEEQMNAYIAEHAHKDVKIEDLQKLVIHLRHQHEQQQQQHEHALKEQEQQHRKQQQQQQAAYEAAAAGLRSARAKELVLTIVADRFLRVMLRSRFDLVSFAFHKVKTFARVTILKAILLRRVALRLLGNLRTVMFARWKFLMRDRAHRYSLAERSRKLVLKSHRIYTNLAFACWKQKSLNLRRKRVGAMRAIVRMLMRLQAWSLDQWHSNCCRLKHQRGALKKAIRRWQRRLLLSTFLVSVFSHLYCVADEFITRFCWPIASLTSRW